MSRKSVKSQKFTEDHEGHKDGHFEKEAVKRARFGSEKFYGRRNGGVSLQSLLPPVRDSVFASFVISC